MTCTHESILKLISYRYGLGTLTKRHRYASNIGRSFDFTKRKFDPPELPDPAAIAATPCSLGGSGERPKQHDLVSLETSGLLDRLGYEVPKVTYDSLFRYPDRVRRAFEAGNRAGAAAPLNGKGPREGALGSERTFRQRIPPLARRSFSFKSNRPPLHPP